MGHLLNVRSLGGGGGGGGGGVGRVGGGGGGGGGGGRSEARTHSATFYIFLIL